MTHTDNEPTVAELWTLIQEQRQELAELRASVTKKMTTTETLSAPKHRGKRSGSGRLSRGRLLRLATVGAAGVAGLSLVSPEEAAACDGFALNSSFVAMGNSDACDYVPCAFYTGTVAESNLPRGVGVAGSVVGVYGESIAGSTNDPAATPVPTGTGIYGAGDAIGVRGVSSGGDGVQGQTSSAGQTGVFGQNTAAGKGVFGASNGGVGVEGRSTGWIGIHGVSDTSTAAQGDSSSGWGVYGHSGSNHGVVGDTTSSTNVGVLGNNFGSGPGVRGTSTSGDGVQGVATDAGHSGVYGNHTAGGKGIFGSSTSGSGVEGTSTTGPGVRGTSLGGDGVQGQANGSDQSGVYGNNPYGGRGVFGASSGGSGSGVEGGSDSGPGIRGTSGKGAGGSFSSTSGPQLHLDPASSIGAPTSGSFAVGDIWLDAAGTTFVCRTAGSPGTWQRLSSIIPLPPIRVLNTRPAKQIGPYTGPIANNTVLTLALAGTNGIPGNATGVIGNLTAADATGSCFLALVPHGANHTGVSSVNFPVEAAGVGVANAFTVGLSSDGKVDIYTGNCSSYTVNIIMDITGYIL